MKEITLVLTEAEALYLRSALCDRNLKCAVKMHRCEREGNHEGAEWQAQQRDTGHIILKALDNQMKKAAG